MIIRPEWLLGLLYFPPGVSLFLNENGGIEITSFKGCALDQPVPHIW
jgi:hypothetical protein